MRRSVPGAALVVLLAGLVPALDHAAGHAQAAPAYLLKPARVFDGEDMHEGWAVLVRGHASRRAGPAAGIAAPGAGDRSICRDATLLPGLIDAHSHVLLHPYNETSWNDQVLQRAAGAARGARGQSPARDAARPASPPCATSAPRARATRTSGCKQAVEPGHHARAAPDRRRRARSSPPAATRRRASRRAWTVPQGAEEADGADADARRCATRSAAAPTGSRSTRDYRVGPARRGVADVLAGRADARSSRRRAAAAGRSWCTRRTAEGMRRAVLAGVETIEHGDGGTPEVFG